MSTDEDGLTIYLVYPRVEGHTVTLVLCDMSTDGCGSTICGLVVLVNPIVVGHNTKLFLCDMQTDRGDRIVCGLISVILKLLVRP